MRTHKYLRVLGVRIWHLLEDLLLQLWELDRLACICVCGFLAQMVTALVTVCAIHYVSTAEQITWLYIGLCCIVVIAAAQGVLGWWAR